MIKARRDAVSWAEGMARPIHHTSPFHRTSPHAHTLPPAPLQACWATSAPLGPSRGRSWSSAACGTWSASPSRT